MYTLMRGLAASFLLGFSNYFGWGLATVHLELLRAALAVILVVAFAAAMLITILTILDRKLPCRGSAKTLFCSGKTLFFCVALVSFCSGYLSGFGKPLPHQAWESLFATIATLFLALRCLVAYKYFAHQFAVAIYRDFSTHSAASDDAAAKG